MTQRCETVTARARPRRASLASLIAPVVCAALVLCIKALPGGAADDALDAANAAFGKVDDYRMVMTTHEVDGDKTEDHTFIILFKKPSFEKLDVVAGRGRGSGIVWIGGDTVKGHRGGILSGFRVTLNLRDPQMLSLHGESIDQATIPAIIQHFLTTKGTLSQTAGPPIDGAPSVAVTLDVASPATNRAITREVLYLSAATHLPVRREAFVGTLLVKNMNFIDTKTNVGLTTGDFPW